MVNPVIIRGDGDAALEAKEKRIQELERCLAEAETNLKAVVSQQIDAVLTSENTIPLLLRQAQQALQRSNEELEQRVAQRTDELLQANAGLREELAKRKRAEQELQKAHNTIINERNRLLAVMDANPIGLAILDEKGASVQFNAAFGAVWGSACPPAHSIDDYDGYKAWWGISGERVKPEEWASTQAVQKGETVTGQFFRIEKFDGSEAFVLNSSAPVRDDRGNIIGASVAVMDITDRVQSERTLFQKNETIRQSEEKFAKAFRYNPAAMMITRVSDGRYLDANESFCKMTGYSREEQIGHTPVELNLTSEEARQAILRSYREMGQVRQQEFSITSRNGEPYVILFSMDPIEVNGEPCNLVTMIDITARKRAEAEQQRLTAAIQQERDRLSALINSITDEIWFADADQKIVLVNPAVSKQFGERAGDAQAVEQVVASLEIYRADGTPRPAGEALLIRALQGETVLKEEEIIRTPASGELRYRQVNAAPVRGLDGSIVGSVAVVRDITEHKQAEQALEKAYYELTNERNRLLAVLAALPIGVSILDSEGGILQVNREYEAIWGGPSPVTQSVDDYAAFQAWWGDTGLALKPEEWASAQAVQKGETVTGQLLQIQRFDGRRAFVLNSGSPIRDANGAIVGSTVAMMDITERVQSERALRESEERFRVAISALPMTVFTLDRDLRYTWVYNPLLGMNAQQILGKRDDEIFPEEISAEMLAVKQSVIDTCQEVQQELSITFNNEPFYYLESLEPICNASGEVIGVIGASLDITAQKKIDIERMNALAHSIVQRQLLKNREQERQEIAHELHDGPIQLLSGTIFIIQSIKEAESNSELKIDLDQVAFHLSDVVHELREMMKELRPPAIIQFGFTKSARMYAQDFREKYPEIQLDLQLFEDYNLLPETVCLALFRIFQEGLNNIVKHASASHISVRFSTTGKQVELEIQDNGEGFQLPPDLVEQIQLKHFGLAGMQERADAIGGNIVLLSGPGKGTSIRVVVPIG